MARINTSQNLRIIKREDASSSSYSSQRSKRPRLGTFEVGKVPSQRGPSFIESPTSAVQTPTTVSVPSVQQGLSSSVHEERATNIGTSMGRESPRSLASTTVLHGEVMREYGENELLGFSLDQSSLFIQIISLLNGKVFETFRNMENGFITLQKVWSFAKYHIIKTEHGYSQHFTNKSEFPAADTEIEDELKRNIVCVEQSIRCAYPGCMCKGKIWPSRNAAQQHLQNLNVIYFCAACGQNFNARTTALSHHRTNCSILKNEGLEYVKIEIHSFIIFENFPGLGP
uniref:C2H2-type domain-containing protein n=1 Tax=Tetranychus urticae TaxID=32264 RepID=T1K6Z5_TETUR